MRARPTIARAIIGLCHSLGLEVTAEGIECHEQLAMLADLAPICLQGYLLARPAAAGQASIVRLVALPDHMTSLLLTRAGVVTPPEAARPGSSVTQLRAHRR